MCIRDRRRTETLFQFLHQPTEDQLTVGVPNRHEASVEFRLCLLYTSDAADERSSVDLGGRRIIKKKKNMNLWEPTTDAQQNEN